MDIIETLRNVASWKRQSKALVVAIEAFNGQRLMSKTVTAAVARIGRATCVKDEAKRFAACNPAQTIDVIKNKANALKRAIEKPDFVGWTRNVALQSDVAVVLDQCEQFLTLWKENKQTIKAEAKAA